LVQYNIRLLFYIRTWTFAEDFVAANTIVSVRIIQCQTVERSEYYIRRWQEWIKIILSFSRLTTCSAEWMHWRDQQNIKSLCTSRQRCLFIISSIPSTSANCQVSYPRNRHRMLHASVKEAGQASWCTEGRAMPVPCGECNATLAHCLRRCLTLQLFARPVKLNYNVERIFEYSWLRRSRRFQQVVAIVQSLPKAKHMHWNTNIFKDRCTQLVIHITCLSTLENKKIEILLIINRKQELSTNRIQTSANAVRNAKAYLSNTCHKHLSATLSDSVFVLNIYISVNDGKVKKIDPGSRSGFRLVPKCNRLVLP